MHGTFTRETGSGEGNPRPEISTDVDGRTRGGGSRWEQVGSREKGAGREGGGEKGDCLRGVVRVRRKQKKRRRRRGRSRSLVL